MHWPKADRQELQDFALTYAWDTPPEMMSGRSFRTLPGGWAVALSVNR